MVKTGKGKEVASSATSPKKSKKIKRKSTFYSSPVYPDHEVSESLPVSPSLPQPGHTEDESQSNPENESDEGLTDNVDSVNIYDINFQIRTRKSESHWYMIYYDGSIDITDDDDSDIVESSEDSLQLIQKLSFGCAEPKPVHGGDIEMVCAVNLLC